MFRLETKTWFPLRREEIFPFFSEAENLEKITPSSLRFEIVTERPIQMAEGTLIDYRIRIWGVPQRWRTRISRWEPPVAFVDEQLKGPYRKWIHLHHFEEEGGGTLMRDRVDYQLPMGAMGALCNPFIRLQLKHIFTHRGKVIPRYLCPDQVSQVRLSSIAFKKMADD